MCTKLLWPDYLSVLRPVKGTTLSRVKCARILLRPITMILSYQHNQVIFCLKKINVLPSKRALGRLYLCAKPQN